MELSAEAQVSFFLIVLVLGIVWMLADWYVLEGLKEFHPEDFNAIRGPESGATDLSLLRIWRWYRFLLRGGHRSLPRRRLRIAGEVVLVCAPLWVLLVAVLGLLVR